MIRKLSGTTAVITGATSGIGRETALEFARAGAAVVIAGRREDRLQQLVSEIESTGGHALGVATDVAEQAQVVHLMLECSINRRHASWLSFDNDRPRESLSTLGQGVALTFRTSGGPDREIRRAAY